MTGPTEADGNAADDELRNDVLPDDEPPDGDSPGDESADEVVTAAELATHLQCPRQYEFEHERPLSPATTSRDRLADRRRELVRESIIAGLSLDAASPDERVAVACERLDGLRATAESSSLVAEQVRYDREVVETAIEEYFGGDGHDHAERLVAADETLSYERDGVRYETTVDAVVERDSGYLALEYRPTMNGVLNVGWYDDNVRRFEEGEGFYPRQIGSLVRAAVAIRGLTSEYGLTPNYDFAYVALLEDSRPAYEAAGEIHVEVARRHFGSSYEREKADVNALVEARAAALRDGETDPRDWQFDAIAERSCSYCAYRNACPDSLESELSFADRPRDESDESPDEPPVSDLSTEENP